MRETEEPNLPREGQDLQVIAVGDQGFWMTIQIDGQPQDKIWVQPPAIFKVKIPQDTAGKTVRFSGRGVMAASTVIRPA